MNPTEEILRETPWSKVVRQTQGTSVQYLKTVAPALRHEVALHFDIARRHPELIPVPVTSHEEECWFTLFDAGPMLRESNITMADWEALLPLYARLQRDEEAHINDYLALGVPDRRPAALLLHFPELEDLPSLVELVNSGPIPMTLNHGDLHDGNIFRGGKQGYRILDWGDASISHPFCSLRTVMVSMEIRFKLDENDPELDRLRAIYLDTWTDIAPLAELQAIEKQVRPLASLLSALSWRLSLSCATPEEAAPYAHVDAALLGEFQELYAAL